MIYGLYNSAAGMLVNEYQQSVLSNNLANADTPGFKREVAVFAERLPASQAGNRDGASADWLASLTGGVWLGHTTTDHSQGPHVRTGNPLDATINGPGFFVVRGADGPAYTRDGRFTLTAGGQLVAASDGAPVMGVGDSPIVVNPAGPQPTIDESGRLMQGEAIIGQLAVVDFDNYAALLKAGEGRFVAGEGAGERASIARIEREFIEGSAVEAVPELTTMMNASRSYQFNARMLQLQDESLGRMISVISRG